MLLATTRQLPPTFRHHRPATDREGSPQSGAADGRAATSDRIRKPRPTVGTLIPVYDEQDDPDVGRPAVRLLAAEIRSFVTIGVASTIAYVVLYGGLRVAASAAVANAVALVLTAIGNTAANRRLTFGVRGRASLLRDHAAGLAAFGLALAITTGAVWLLEQLAPNPGRLAEIGVLVAANGLATVSRFVLLRSWISSPRRATPSDGLEGSLS
jgi:putative flippase GtrA